MPRSSPIESHTDRALCHGERVADAVRTISPSAYRRVTRLVLVALCMIVVTGGAVRVTGSGLGCPDWPTCAEGRVVAPLETHALIEFVNRVVTGAVSVLVIVAVLGALVRRPRRLDLVWLAVGLVAGVIGQVVLGGLVVLFHLNPVLVMGHFIVSMFLVADAVVLHHRAGWPDGSRALRLTSDETRRSGSVLVVATGLVIGLGTIVTGSGPHAGSRDGEVVRRLPFSVGEVARLHGGAVVLFLAIALMTVWMAHREAAPSEVLRRGEMLLGVAVAQAALGYVQYFTGVPAVLVGAHIAGATGVWVTVLRFRLGLQGRTTLAIVTTATGGLDVTSAS